MDRKMFDMSEFYRTSGIMRNDNDDCTDPLTMVFINMQPLDSVYTLSEAFCNGTLFPNLNKPFFGGMSDER